ncbi:uncharacterized protein [Anabrus simplex]|uniref:uncharacterized protein n=1 Tax=Anabrus simplex TaxID=316456 RepID=UPI0035A281E2
MRKFSKYNYSYDVNWTTQVEFSDTNGIKIRFDVSKWGAGGWGLNAYKYETDEPCKAGKQFGKDLMLSFLSSSGVDPPECPVKPGAYYLSNWTVDLDPSYFPELPYGTYKGECIFLHDNERFLCWQAIILITEKAVL